MAAIAGLTAQNTRGLRALELPSPRFVAAQIEAVLDDIRVDAIKIGALPSAAVAGAVAEVLEARWRGPLVLDPVLLASSGDRLAEADTAEVLIQRLLPLAAVLTPNLPEAAALTGLELTGPEQLPAAAAALLALGPGAVLIKGGHAGGDSASDLLARPGELLWLSAPRVPTADTHGTGCTLSSAIAAHLARGLALPAACRAAKAYLSGALSAPRRIAVGSGPGPLDHFYREQTHATRD